MLTHMLIAALALALAAPLSADPYIHGPAAVTLGAEAQLQLPEGWRFAPRWALKQHFGADGRAAGAWDRGVLLPSEEGLELRMLFEPLGAVALEPLPQVEPLLLQAQALAREALTRPGAATSVGRELAFWRWEPFFQPDLMSLRFGGLWRQEADETVSMHVRWLARHGVLKLDWRGPEDQADAFSAAVERLEEGLRFNAGQSRAEATAQDRPAALDLSGLVLDGLLGRAATAPGGTVAKPWPWWTWLGLGLGCVGLLIAAVLWAWRRLEAWLDQRQKRIHDERRLEHLERTLGGRADDVEMIEEEAEPNV